MLCIMEHNGLIIILDKLLCIYLYTCFSPGTADYNPQSFPVTIAPGNVTHQFIIDIINDNIVECNETFSLSIPTEGTWCGLNNNNGSAQVTIVNDDGKNV